MPHWQIALIVVGCTMVLVCGGGLAYTSKNGMGPRQIAEAAATSIPQYWQWYSPMTLCGGIATLYECERSKMHPALCS